MNRTLHPHQENIIQRLRASLGSGKRRPMVFAPTGFGKTIVAAAIVERALRLDKRVIFAVPKLALVDQTVERFFEEGIHDVGVMQGVHAMTNWLKPVQVASIQTLMRRAVPQSDLVLIDEAHQWFKFVGTWMNLPGWRADPEAATPFPGVPFIGLSATPWARGLGQHYDDLLIAATTKQLMDAGYLSKFRVFAPTHPDLGGVRTVAGDYHEGDLSDAMDKPSLVADVVETWIQRGENRSTLCFGVNRPHAKNLQQQFLSRGVPAGYVDAYTTPDERTAIRDRFHSADLKVVCSVGTLTTGVDWDVRCISLARPTKSEMLFCQIIGRGLRTAEGKDDCLILDHSDNHARLGFVTDIHHDRLDTGKGRKAAERVRPQAKPKECTKCHFMRPPKVHRCPSCGFEPERQANVDVEDGELVEVGADRRGRMAASRLQKRMDYGQLLWIAQSRGYSDGWAKHKFRERFGTWPNGLDDARPIDPTDDMLRWVKSRQIAYAKGMEKQRGGGGAHSPR